MYIYIDSEHDRCAISQAAAQPKAKEHTPPSPFNLVLAMFSCFVCPLLGWLSIIFAVQVREVTPGSTSTVKSLE